MELKRKQIGNLWNDDLMSWTFGAYEEMLSHLEEYKYPIVIKTAAGAMSRGVFLAQNEDDLKRKVKKISRTPHYIQDIKDWLRPLKHKGYQRESLYRNKFILQQFVPNQKNFLLLVQLVHVNITKN